MTDILLGGESAIWRQKWIRQLAENPNVAIPQTATDSLFACYCETFPIINKFLTILVTLPVSTASV